MRQGGGSIPPRNLHQVPELGFVDWPAVVHGGKLPRRGVVCENQDDLSATSRSTENCTPSNSVHGRPACANATTYDGGRRPAQP